MMWFGGLVAVLLSCRPAVAADGSWVEAPPPTRSYHAAVYEPVRDEMVVLGGFCGAGTLYQRDTWALSFGGDARWSKLSFPGTPPPDLGPWLASYDSGHDRVICLAPTNDGSMGVWTMECRDPSGWERILPSGLAPERRDGASIIYDSAYDRIILFGGLVFRDQTKLYLNDVWALSLRGAAAWTRLTISGPSPSPRWSHAAIYDSSRQRMLVFGGYGEGNAYPADLWALKLDDAPAWNMVETPGATPAGRWGHSLIYDPVADRGILYAGYAGSGLALGDVWELRLAGTTMWSPLEVAGKAPPSRLAHSAVYDSRNQQMIVFGGEGGPDLNDTWALTLTGPPAWARVDAPDSLPEGRSGHTATYDPLRHRILVFAGQTDDYRLLNDLWSVSLDGAPHWAAVPAAGTPPSPRAEHTTIYDSAGDRLIVFGGRDSTGLLGDVWAVTLGGSPTWTRLSPSGPGPEPRSGHTAVYDAADSRMVVFGGQASSSAMDDSWSLALGPDPRWEHLSTGGMTPPRRTEHAAVLDPSRRRMWVFGGRDSDLLFDDLWELDLTGQPFWHQVDLAGDRPRQRVGHTAVYDGSQDRLLIYGGEYFDQVFTALADVWELALGPSYAWRQLMLAPGPSLRTESAAVFDGEGDRMLLVGGYHGRNDIWSLDFSGSKSGVPLSGGATLRVTPNPTNDQLRVEFGTLSPENVRVEIFDLSGRQVRALFSGLVNGERYGLWWDGRDAKGAVVPSGVYFCSLSADGHERLARRFILLR